MCTRFDVIPPPDINPSVKKFIVQKCRDRRYFINVDIIMRVKKNSIKMTIWIQQIWKVGEGKRFLIQSCPNLKSRG